MLLREEMNESPVWDLGQRAERMIQTSQGIRWIKIRKKKGGGGVIKGMNPKDSKGVHIQLETLSSHEIRQALIFRDYSKLSGFTGRARAARKKQNRLYCFGRGAELEEF